MIFKNGTINKKFNYFKLITRSVGDEYQIKTYMGVESGEGVFNSPENTTAFLQNYSNFSPSMKLLAHNKSERKNFLDIIVKNSETEQDITPEEICDSVSRTVGENEEAVLAFSKAVLRVCKTPPIKDPRVGGEGVLRNPEFWEKIGLEYEHIPLHKVGISDTFIAKFSDNLDLTSGNLIPFVEFAQKAAETNEFLAFLTMAQVIVKIVGMPLFYIGYYSLCVETSFKHFLSGVRAKVEYMLTPIYSVIKITFIFVYHNRFQILGAFGTGGLLSYGFRNGYFKVKPMAVGVTTVALTEVVSAVLEKETSLAVPNSLLVPYFNGAKELWLNISRATAEFTFRFLQDTGNHAIDVLFGVGPKK